MRRWLAPALTTGLVIVLAGAAFAQGGGFFRRGPIDVPIDKAPPYDGRFTFARLKYTTGPGGYYFRGGLPAWAHGYLSAIQGHRSESSLTKILDSVTNMRPHTDGTRVVDVADPELFDYPIVYATEPGFMALDDKDVRALHDYIAKGGFIIFDDFRGPYDWENFTESIRRVLPGEQPIELALTHPIFHSFFEIGTLDFHQAYDRGKPAFYGYFAKNDQSQPLQMIVNFNNDVSEYWEFSDTGFAPIDLSNEAYKLGVNYVIYAMTH
ncbi:MAG TPA: DUF4159 domain-containing protein [Vicinamibacterales bacterium]|jgi:Domain of unknown function (DUF4159)|nr:DUF4159 domain-containing protein [Vicinamibacterales bacterium]